MQQANMTVVITGAAKGLGLELTRQCLIKNMNVVMIDYDNQALTEQVVQAAQAFQAKVMPICADVRNRAQISSILPQIYEHFGQVDWLINNAGICGEIAPLWELDTQAIKNVIDINLYGTINMIQGFLPEMFKQPNPSKIINICSVYSLCSGSQLAAYTMSKQAMLAMSESLYFDLKRLNKPVDVAVVCPSFMNTNLIDGRTAARTNAFNERLLSFIHHSRCAKEVAALIIEDIPKDKFYILPDQEIKAYFSDRMAAIVNEGNPDTHQLEKMMSYLCQRSGI